MGETSKTIGEIGENIAGKFFELIGWHNALPNESLKCLKPQKHARKESKKGKRETHGIDYLYSYRSPLEGNSISNVIISVKNTDDPYPNNPVSKFKDHISDLAQTIECFNGSPAKASQLKKFKHYKKSSDIGVLFWLSQSDDTYHDVVSKLENCRLDSGLKFGVIYVVDNKRIEFIFQAMNFLKLKHPDHSIYFYYPDTSMNYEDNEIPQYGSSLPVEYINSPIIPFLLKKGKEELDTFCIAVADNFDEEEMPMLIQAARKYTKDIRCNYLFLFPNYIRTKHHKSVINAINSFENEVGNNIQVMSYKPDYRSLNDAG
jgi:hypothetical protein